ncbi:MAG: adenosylcobinamide-GDP ribazoletransferase [Solirubrobacteraceae bacterium]
MHARAETPAAAARRSSRPWDGLASAITFLTILPVPGAGEAGLGSAAAWFPVVGAAVGALAGGVRLLCGEAVGATVATVLAMIVLVVVTGALHQDGLADTADGLGVRGDRARRLEVMRDSSTGGFGALALIGWALLLYTTLSSLDGDRALRALVVACALARWAALAHAAATRPARSDGLGAALRVGPVALGVATAFAVIVALAVGGLVPGGAAIGAAVVVAWLSVMFARGALGGRTGDTLGATVAIVEVAVCVVLLGVWVG